MPEELGKRISTLEKLIAETSEKLNDCQKKDEEDTRGQIGLNRKRKDPCEQIKNELQTWQNELKNAQAEAAAKATSGIGRLSGSGTIPGSAGEAGTGIGISNVLSSDATQPQIPSNLDRAPEGPSIERAEPGVTPLDPVDMQRLEKQSEDLEHLQHILHNQDEEELIEQIKRDGEKEVEGEPAA